MTLTKTTWQGGRGRWKGEDREVVKVVEVVEGEVL